MNDGIREGLATLLIGAALAVGPGSVIAQPAPATEARDELLGIWGGQRDFGPYIRGTLTIERDGRQWHAGIAGRHVRAAFADGTLTFDLPGDEGSFRGFLETTTGTIRGQWTQPGAVSMFRQRFSTPVQLTQAGPNLWRGIVHPLLDRVRIFCVFEPRDDGSVRAYLRNPEVNFGRLFDFQEVRRGQGSVDFRGTLAWQKEAAPRVLIDGIERHDQHLLSIFIEDLGGTYDLEKLEARGVSDFHPRSWARESYRYHRPAPKDDGWETAGLGDVGMAVEPIEALVRKIISTPMDAIDAPWIDAVLIARNGKLVLEEYFHGQGPDRTHDTRSASKSLTSTLVGAAIHAGSLSLGTKVYELMNGGVMPESLDPRAARMTVEHLVTMTSGLACDDWDASSPGGEDRMQSQTEQPDWRRYTLDLPMIHEPGERPAYCSGGMNLAGGIVARATGRPLTEAFDRYLARPLQMGTYHTNLAPDGEAYAGGGMRIQARDFLKFGQLMLNDGEWNGRRILDRGWSGEATKRRHDLGGKRLGSYGYGWWLIEYELGGQRWGAFYAGGNGGNYIIGVPELDVVIVFFGSNYNQAVQHETKIDYVPEFILRSVVEGTHDGT